MTYKEKFGVIFDLDGVIIDSSHVMKKAFEYSFNIFFPNQTASYSEFVKHTGKGFLKIMADMGLPLEMYPYFNQKSIELASEIEVFDGVKELATILKEKNHCYVGISTGKDSFRTHLILKETGLLPYFDKVICNDQLERGKPYPDSINAHLEFANLERSHVVFVGDSIADIQCAHNANVSSIAALWGLGKREDLINENPDYLANDIEELRSILCQRGIIKSEHAICLEGSA